MGTLHFEGEATIAARPEIVWDILSDYRDGHPRILPEEMTDLIVEEGGRGEGTLVRFNFHLSGLTRQIHARVHTPEPGRILVEENLNAQGVTTFTLTPLEEGQRTHVRIMTETPEEPGLAGLIGRAFAPMVTRRMRAIYLKELANLDALAQTWVPQQS